MAIEVTMPKLGLTMAEGKIVEWRKKEGDNVEKGEILFVIETEKITYEYESPASGILGKIVVPVGDTVPVTTIVAYILKPGEKMAEIPVKAKEAITEAPGKAAAPTAVSVSSQPTKEATSAGEKIKVSPLARKLAEESGIDISKVTGTGPEGRIVKEDILRAVEEAKTIKPTAKPATEAILPSKTTLVPLTGMRRTIAQRMSQSFQTAPHCWVHTRVEATRLEEAREQLLPSIEKQTGLRMTYTDLLVKILAQALEDYPILNSRWTDNGIELMEDVNIGVATNVPEGLVVPVIHQANKKSLAEITRSRADIVSRAREGKLGLDEMTNGTITITNLGVTTAGIVGIYQILNPPEAAILGLGPLVEEPIVVDKQVVARLCINFTLTFDHRILDGFTAAQFMSRIKELVEQPLLLFL